MSERSYNMLRGCVELESIIPIAVKPNIASIGGFTAIDKVTGKCIVFDWEESSGGCNTEEMKDDNKTLSMDWEMKNFDYEFFESQPDSESSVYITQERLNELIELDNQDKLEEFLTSCEIDEIHYECFIGVDEEVHVPMKIVNFSIGDYKFSEEQIKNYNKKVYLTEMDTQLKQTKDYFDKFKKELDDIINE